MGDELDFARVEAVGWSHEGFRWADRGDGGIAVGGNLSAVDGCAGGDGGEQEPGKGLGESEHGWRIGEV